MIGNSKPLLKYMDGSDTRFIIPVYQRNYDWKKENCKQLFDDLVKVVEEGRASHFFGSIVSAADGSDSIIIDGQQRLTTVSLLLLALSKLIEEAKIPCEQGNLADKIVNGYLVDQWQPETRKVKLKPVKEDQKAFNNLFGASEDYVAESKVTQNYLFFYEAIQSCGISADDLFAAIRKLIIVDISLEEGDNPQLIFESLNSTGLDLSEADKIRNYVLMGLPRVKQEIYYEKYWNRIEEYTGYNVSDFIRQYLTYRQAKWPNVSRVYHAFKSYAPPPGAAIEPLFEDMLICARDYRSIATASFGHRAIDGILARMNRLEVSVMNPFLFAVFEWRRKGLVDSEAVAEMLGTVESYLLRRIVCEVPTNALNKIFANLANEVTRVVGGAQEYGAALRYVLLGKMGSSRFPRDDEFEQRIRTRDFYNMRLKNRVYLFDRLENGDSFELVDVPTLMLASKHGLTVEHIMPQSLTEAWRKDLGPGWQATHEKWVNRIANLTLTGYNSKYSNRRFIEKVAMEDGFKDSPLRLNRLIAEKTQWGEAELQEREDVLVKDFLKLWPCKAIGFEFAKNEGGEYSLDDDFDFSGTKVSSYTFMGSKQYSKTWKSAVESILKQVYDLEPSVIVSLASLDEFPGGYFRMGGEGGSGWLEVGGGVYVYLATSTQCKMNLLEAVFERAGIEGSDLSFEIRKEEDAE